MRKHRKTLGDHNAWCAIDLRDANALHRRFKHALIAEPIDQRNGGKQRWREQRNQADAAKQGLERHTRASDRIGEDKRKRQRDHGDYNRHPNAMPQAGEQRRGLNIGYEVSEADEFALLTLKRLQQNGRERKGQKRDQDERNQRKAKLRNAIRPRRCLPHQSRRGGGGRGGYGGGTESIRHN